MARSSSPNWSQTVSQLCHSAARELGAVGISGTLDDDELTEMIIRLNGMLAKWSQDMNMWRDHTATITVGAGVGAATLPAEVQNVRSVRFVESATYKRTLAPWNRDQFMALPNRTQAGQPTAYYYRQSLDGDEIYFWPVPANEEDFELDYARTFYYAEDGTQELDIPREWHEAALYGLASRCAGIFNTIELDPNVVQRCDAQAKATYGAMLDADRPDSYFFEYDSPVEAR